MTIQEIQQATADHDHLQQLTAYNIRCWLESRNKVPQEISSYWTFRDKMAVIDDIILKTYEALYPKIYKNFQIHNVHMGIEKTTLLPCQSM